MKTAVEKSMFWSEIRLGVRGRLVYLVNIYIYIYIFFFFFFFFFLGGGGPPFPLKKRSLLRRL